MSAKLSAGGLGASNTTPHFSALNLMPIAVWAASNGGAIGERARADLKSYVTSSVHTRATPSLGSATTK